MIQLTNRGAIWIAVGVILAGVILVWCFLLQAKRDTNVGSAFINPSLQHVENESLSLGARLALQERIEAYANAAIQHGIITNYGLYYRELISGPVIVLREDENFSPASLLKLPVAMWYFKQEERTPGLLDEQIHFTGPKGVSIEHYPSPKVIEENHTYTVRELIALMLVESDNDATGVLVEYAGGRDRINEVYQELGIKDVFDYDQYIIDVHTYAAFFRVLYNAEYLTEEHSADLLELLSESSFSEGLVSGVPDGVRIAHKFGERDLDSHTSQLHDCGIVYAPRNPYLLCIMTQGGDYRALATFIADVSSMVYDAAGNP